MSATLRWTSERKIGILMELIEASTCEDFHYSVNDAHNMARQVNHAVHLIVQVPARMPDGNPLMHFSGAIQRQPDNMGRIFIVPPCGQSNFIFAFAKRLSMIIDKVYAGKSHVIFVQSVEQALMLIGEEMVEGRKVLEPVHL